LPSEVDKEPENSPVDVAPHKETGDWPDPLEFAAASNKTPTESAAPEEEPKIIKPSVKEDEKSEKTTPSEENSPLTSPFLPGTKVEKRPLGANAIATTVSDDIVEVDENAQLPANPKDVEPILPEELHGDVMAIESDTTTPPPTPEKPAVAEAAPMPSSATFHEAKVEKEEPKITGPTSISQQYREEPSTGDQASGAIYDTDSYHQPLAHPAKKKSGWMWIVWIILILIVGAAGGAALYFFKIV